MVHLAYAKDQVVSSSVYSATKILFFLIGMVTETLVRKTMKQPLVYGIGTCAKKGYCLGKKTMMCGEEGFNDFINMKNYNAEWWYNWGCNSDKYHAENHTCASAVDANTGNKVAMIFGMYDNTDYSCHNGTNTSYILGANEPCHKKQSNVAPAVAAERWALLDAASNGLPLVSPSASDCGSGPTNCPYGNKYDWFDAWIGNCTALGGCRFEYIATHKYSCKVNKTMDDLEFMYNRYGRKKIAVTELSCRVNNNQNPIAQQKVITFMEEILDRLDQADFIHSYAWFTMRLKDDSKLVGTASSLTYPNNATLKPLGQIYFNHEC